MDPRLWLAVFLLCPARSVRAQVRLESVRLNAAIASPMAAPILYSPTLSAPSLALPSAGLSPAVQAPAAAPKVAAAPQSAAQPAGTPASPEELAFVARAALDLAIISEEWGEENGRKFKRMTGQDFPPMLEAGMARYAERYQAKAPSARAFAAAATVQKQMLRIVKAMLKPDAPLDGQVRRILSVWNVFNQAMDEAAQKGSLEPVEDEARLFASQVEQSV